jgi:hypothetical protein
MIKPVERPGVSQPSVAVVNQPSNEAKSAGQAASGGQESVPAVLLLADGTLLRGLSFGARGTVVGEVVFNTGMTG